MSPAISFRPLERSDYPALRRWLNTPHVYEWWGSDATQWGLGGPGERAASLADVEASFGPGIEGRDATDYFIIEIDGQGIGLIQSYMLIDHPEYAETIGEAKPGIAGIDLMIGEPDKVGHGLGTAVVDEFMRSVIFTRPDVERIIAAPDNRNARSIRAFEKAGFRFLRDAEIPGEPAPHRLLERLR